MNRRTALALSLGATASLSGCVSRVRPPSVTADEPTLSPGTQATLSVTARSVKGLRFAQLPTADRVVVDVNDAAISPPPSAGVDTYPPVWYWRFARWSVRLNLPIRIPDDAPPGEYRYAVGVTATDDIRSDETTEEFSMRVTEG